MVAGISDQALAEDIIRDHASEAEDRAAERGIRPDQYLPRTMMTRYIQLALIPTVVSDSIVKKTEKNFAGKLCVAKVLHLGAGRQSSAIAEMIVEGDLPPVDFVIFADTGAEPPWVYDQVAYLQTRLESISIPLHIVRKSPNAHIVRDAQTELRWVTIPFYTRSADGTSGRVTRQCTNEYKIQPCHDFVLEWMTEAGYATRATNGSRRVNWKRYYIEEWFGISADESYRVNLARGASWQRTVYPLVERGFRTQDCIDYLLARGLPVPKKSSCIICPFHEDEYWLMLAMDYPALFEEACIFDDWLRSLDSREYRSKNGVTSKAECYLHRSCQPLREVDFATRKRGGVSGWQLELMTGETCSSDGGFSCMS